MPRAGERAAQGGGVGMGWRGEHIGPAGTSSGVMFANWIDAADWVRAMMNIQSSPGLDREVVVFFEDEPFMTRIGDHLYRIERDGR